MKNNEKILSIVIPVYNVEKYLEKCLLSITEQLTTEIELILINDGSQDNSDNICKKFSLNDIRIKYINKKNEGCSKTRNLGINLAKGKYIWFIDSDDFIEEYCIKQILNELKKTEIDILIFGYKRIEKNKVYKVIPKKIKEKFEIYNQKEIFNSPCNKLYKTDLIKKENIFFPEDSHMGEDMVFNFKCFCLANKLEIIEKSYYNYIETEGATSSLSKKIEIFYSFDDIIKFFKENNKFEEMKEVLKEYYKLHAVKLPFYFITYQATKNKNINKRLEFNKIEKEIIKRKSYFKSTFIKERILYKLRDKLYFLKFLIKR